MLAPALRKSGEEAAQFLCSPVSEGRMEGGGGMPSIGWPEKGWLRMPRARSQRASQHRGIMCCCYKAFMALSAAGYAAHIQKSHPPSRHVSLYKGMLHTLMPATAWQFALLILFSRHSTGIAWLNRLVITQ